ncbi:MAG: hypothetical protein HKN91_16735, partial [Acidimicrobiia bacterium]|nr:hypothetical protein [Acidimicrobiia bacterium]
ATALTMLAIALNGCTSGASGGATTVTFSEEGVTTNAPQPSIRTFDATAPVDRVVELMPGGGVEAKLIAELDGYVPDSGEHLASLDTGDGRFDVFVFMSDQVPHQAGEGEAMVCKAVARRDRAIRDYGCSVEPEVLPLTGIHSASTDSGDGSAVDGSFESVDF